MTKLKQRKTALVTGASNGIGRAIALQLADLGYNLLLVGRNKARLEKVETLTLRHGVAARSVSLDIAKPLSVRRLKQEIASKYGRLDVLVHCAGTISLKTIETASEGELEKQMSVNLFAPYRLTKALLPILKANQGQIVFVNSSIVVNPRPGTALFAMTQHALKGFADSLRAEVNAHGVRVISLYPGRTATSRQKKIFNKEGRHYKPDKLMQPEDLAKLIGDVLAQPITTEVTDIHVRPTIKW